MSLSSLWTHRKEEAKKRLDVCVTCDKYDPKTTRCQECGCFMIAKTLLPFTECPLGKWGKFEEPNDTEPK